MSGEQDHQLGKTQRQEGSRRGSEAVDMSLTSKAPQTLLEEDGNPTDRTNTGGNESTPNYHAPETVVAPRHVDVQTKQSESQKFDQLGEHLISRTPPPLRESSSGFLASLTSSEISSPLQSTSASSTSLQSSQASNDIPDVQAIASPARSLERTNPVSSFGNLYVTSHSATSSRSSQGTTLARAERPHYPNQSLAALHTQQHTLPYAFMKSRSSDFGHAQPASASPSRNFDRAHIASVSRSADQTPLGSPGLFQLQRKTPSEAGSGQTSPSYLHAAQTHIPPKETSKLIKDFDATTGNKTMNNYEILEKLGVGSHGAVKRARNLVTEEEVAIKIVRRHGRKGRLGKQDSPEDKIKKEVAVLKKARHPHVVSLLEVIDDPEYGKVYLVLEFVKKGEIIWRTETTKEIADFEMNRYNRELAGTGDPEVEADLLSKLNAKLDAAHRRQAKLDAVSLQQDLSPASADSSEDQLGLRRSLTSDHPDANGVGGTQSENFYGDWSFESGGYEQLTDDERRQSRGLRRRRSVRRAFNLNAELDTPKAGHQVNVRHEGSGTNFPASLVGSYYGPYEQDGRFLQSSIINFQDILSSATQAQQQWTSDEDAFRYVPCLTMTQARETFRDTVLGLEYLHFQGIIHRDIKPANLLWTSDYRVKISDFSVSYIGRPLRGNDDEELGLSSGEQRDEEIELAKTVGTPAFYAPELCDPDLFDTEKTPVRPQITGAIDVWALGVTLYSMIFGRLPFSGDNQFEMFERIAWQEPFISSKRLRGVDETGANPMNSNKRLPHVVEYEEVDDTLKDLIARLLQKDPKRRITLKEVKYHPWVVYGLADPSSWAVATDPALQSKGKKIEVSQKDVQDAVAPLNLVDRIKHSIRRLGSVVRGRDSRRRAESNAKEPHGSGGSTSSRASTLDREARRPSLHGDEQIYSALRASRDTSDHPLSQSVVASPVAEKGESSYFVQPISHLELPSSSTFSPSTLNQRPLPGDRTESTAESIRTIRGTSGIETIRPNSPPTIAEDPSGQLASESAASSSSGLSGILGFASRKLVKSMRSRDRARHSSRDNSSASSRSSSYEQMASSFDEAHSFPSVALSPALAAGQVDHTLLEPDDAYLHRSPQSSFPKYQLESSTSAFERAEEINMRRQILEQQQRARTRSLSRGGTSGATECPPSPDDLALHLPPVGQDQGEEQERAVVSTSTSLRDYFAQSGSSRLAGAAPTLMSADLQDTDPQSSILATADTITAEMYNEQRRKSLGLSASSFGGESGYHGDRDEENSGEGDDESDDEGIMMGRRR